MADKDPMELLPQCFEILESVAAVKGETHAKMAMSLFSMGNIGTFLLNHFSSTPEGTILKQQYEQGLGQFIYCFVDATMKQTPGWDSLEEAEKGRLAQRYMDSLREDVEMLERKQREYCS